MLVANMFAVVAEGLGVVGVASQLAHVFRKNTTKGLSGWSHTLGLGANIGWLSFGLQRNIWPIVIANMIVAPMTLLILCKIFINNGDRLRVIAEAAGVGAILFVTFRYAGSWAGWIAALFNAGASLPQLYRAHKDKSLKGISLYSQILWFSAEICTIVYAVLLSAWPLAIGSTRGLVTNGYLAYQTSKKSSNKVK